MGLELRFQKDGNLTPMSCPLKGKKAGSEPRQSCVMRLSIPHRAATFSVRFTVQTPRSDIRQPLSNHQTDDLRQPCSGPSRTKEVLYLLQPAVGLSLIKVNMLA